MKYLLCFVMLAASLAASAGLATAAVHETYYPPVQAGKKIPLDAGHYFTCSFDRTPKMGQAVFRVEIFTADGRRDTSFMVKGESDMPTMRGAHSSGVKPFQLSRKQVYLLPVSLVMPGEWEVRLVFLKGGKEVYRGSYRFRV